MHVYVFWIGGKVGMKFQIDGSMVKNVIKVVYVAVYVILDAFFFLQKCMSLHIIQTTLTPDSWSIMW